MFVPSNVGQKFLAVDGWPQTFGAVGCLKPSLPWSDSACALLTSPTTGRPGYAYRVVIVALARVPERAYRVSRERMSAIRPGACGGAEPCRRDCGRCGQSRIWLPGGRAGFSDLMALAAAERAAAVRVRPNGGAYERRRAAGMSRRRAAPAWTRGTYRESIVASSARICRAASFRQRRPAHYLPAPKKRAQPQP